MNKYGTPTVFIKYVNYLLLAFAGENDFPQKSRSQALTTPPKPPLDTPI